MATFPCPHCGQPVEADHVYCPHCSRSLRLNVEPPPEVQTVRQPSPKGLFWVIGIGILAVLAMFVLPMILLPSVVKTTPGASGSPRNTDCLSHIKQLAVGHLIYSTDYDDRFVADANFKPAIMPYIKNNDIFACPDTRVEFAANDGILGKDSTLLLDPAGTVMLYEGYNKQLSGAHGGRSSVAYTDSHARMIDASATVDYSVRLGKPPTPSK
jgi:hypothetical protein